MKNRIRASLSTAMLLQTAVLCLLTLGSLGWVIWKQGQTFDYFYCLATIPFVCLPAILSLLFRWRFNEVLYTVFSLYAMGPLLGAVYGLYSTLIWWDDLLHGLAGVLFAACGARLAYVLNRKNPVSYMLAALFGVLLSIGIAVVWEIYEYTADLLLGSDMQADTVIQAIHTKLITGTQSVTSLENITQVTVNGQPLPVEGYLDIGLHDTMLDLILETAGALVYFVYVWIDRDRHPMIRGLSEAKPGETPAAR